VHRSKEGSVTDRHVNHRLSLAGYERVMNDYWFSVYEPKPADIVVDIGAGKGEETYAFSKRVGPGGRVISVEAHPQTFRCLVKLIEHNGLTNVVPVHAAICEKQHDVFINNPEWDQQGSIVAAASGLRIPGLTLDALVKNLAVARIDFLKMNIEGAEALAIQGMSQSIQNTKAVCISCHDFLGDSCSNEQMRTKAKVAAFLEQNGFRIFSRDNDPRPYIRDQLNAFNERLL